MQTISPKAEEILDFAERYIRTVGYNGFSFRDLADAAGIKSASVHYHFATKEILAAAVARRYAERFFAALGDPKDGATEPEAKLDTFIGLFRNALQTDGRMCLFCVLGAEFATLPTEVQAEVRSFFNRCIAWLGDLFGRIPPSVGSTAQSPRVRAHMFVATLEGAMIVARSTGDLATFDSIADQLRRSGSIPA